MDIIFNPELIALKQNISNPEQAIEYAGMLLARQNICRPEKDALRQNSGPLPEAKTDAVSGKTRRRATPGRADRELKCEAGAAEHAPECLLIGKRNR